MAKSNRSVSGEQVHLGRLKINDDLLVMAGRPSQYDLPQSPATSAAMRVLGAGEDLRKMAARSNRNPTAHGRIVRYGETDDFYTVEFRSGKESQLVQIPKLPNISKYNKGTKKIFNYTFIKINQQAYSDGVFHQNFVSFPLQDLIDIGMYSDAKSARRGFFDAFRTLIPMMFSGGFKRGKQTVEQTDLSTMFTNAKIRNGECIVKLNEELNWDFVAAFYTRLPAFYFSLPAKAADLCQYIFIRARQSAKDLRDKGYFTIKNRSIASFLGLPDETEAKNPHREIKRRIEEAIEAIEEKLATDGEMKITPYCEDRASITEYLNNGYLKVELSGDYAKTFLEIADTKTKKIEASKKKKENRLEKALTMNLAKSLETQEPADTKKK